MIPTSQGIGFLQKLRGRAVWAAMLCAVSFFVAGCGDPQEGPITFYLDGAGWYGSSGSVEAGLRAEGYEGTFRTFSWSAYLGPAHDHFVRSKSTITAKRLARRIQKARRANETRQINLMGLSAGSAVILAALERLDRDTMVDNVVLFSPSVSARHNLTKAMRHVRRNLYATCSPHDGILRGLLINADGVSGPPAGKTGFRLPRSPNQYSLEAYQRVINIRWRPSYVGFGWDGGHTSVTEPIFVQSVIAPRVLTVDPYPLDRPVADRD